MKRNALFVGVDQYTDGHIPNLSCAVSDATDLHGFFKYGAGYDRVELLQNPAGKKEVLSKVRELTGDLGSGDFFVLFFAGHGFRVGENHVLVCANDLYEDVKYEDDGLPLGQLKRRLVGAFDSALLLDACQSDILATRGGEGIAERDLSLIHEVPTDRTCGGALTIVTSCDAGQTAAELSEARHGLFTLAMLDLLKEAQGAHIRLDLSDSFKMSLGRRMREIAARSGLSTDQRPRFSCPGETCFILLDGAAPTRSSESVLPTAATFDSALKPCPVCGRNNSTANTFNCIVCGTKNLCISHYSAEYNRCEACAKKKINTKKSLSAFNDNNWDLAYELMQNGDDSDPEGQYVLARLYELGCTYIDNDEDKAFELFGKAAEQGYADAQFKLADYYTVGCSVAKSPQEAYKWYMKAARQGHVEAQDFVGWCYETGFGVDEDLESAFVWYSRAAERGRAAAQCSLGRLYANGEGVEADAEESVKWFRKAADQGNAEAMYELGEHYRLGEGVAQSDDEAIKWYHLAADQGSEDAQDRLDELEPQEESDDEEVEDNQFAQCKADAERGDPCAQYKLGVMYVNGQDVEQSYEEAAKWYREAAEQGHADAQYALGALYNIGNGVEHSLTDAAKWYLKAAEQGHDRAQERMGRFYEKGLGVAQSQTEAIKWYRKAAEHGNADAKKRLPNLEERGCDAITASDCTATPEMMYQKGMAYLKGDGVDKDETKALRYIELAANGGFVKAMEELAEHYYKGYGVNHDYEQAAKWFLKAVANSGCSPYSQYCIGFMYEHGHGVTQSLVEAERWYRKAWDRGHCIARDALSALLKKKTIRIGGGASPSRDSVEMTLSEGSIMGGASRCGRYTGPMVNGKPHGQGRFVASNGEVYEGNFFYGDRSGKGKIRYKDGASYEGGFRNGEWDGEGTYSWPDGTRHVGSFRNGRFHGPGKQINPDGTSFMGTWDDGKFKSYT